MPPFIFEFKKPVSFFFHYNKPKSKSAGYPILSLHFRRKCLFLKSIDCKVSVKTKNNKRQPHLVLKGKTKKIEILNESALLS